MKLDILYEKKFVKSVNTKELFETIILESFNNQIFLDNGGATMPRLIKWYGDIPYAYANIYHPENKLPEFLIPLLKEVNDFLKENNIDSQMNSVLINYYRDGKDKINYHSDDLSQIGENPVICSISLGETRMFSFKHKETKSKIGFELSDGDLCVMKGDTQEKWHHAILPEENKGPRINLTFRNTLNQPTIKANI